MIMKPVALSELTLAKFSELLNGPFRVLVDQSTVVLLRLVAATGHSSAAEARTSQENFSLLFRGPLDRFLPQRMYSFEQEQFGQFDLFIVPIGRDAEGFQYEAFFNREGKRT